MNRETRRAARIAAAIVCGGAAIGWAAPSRAGDEAPAASPAPVAPAARGYVRLEVTGGADEASSLADTLRELAARLGLGLQTGTGGAAAGVGEGERARVRVTETADRADIEMAEVRDGRLGPSMARTLPKNESSAIETEQIAHVVYSALESMVATDSEEAGEAAPEHAPAPLSPPSPVVDRSRSSSVQIPVSLSAIAFASGRGVASGTGPVFGAGGTVALAAWHDVGRPALWVSGTYNTPFDEHTPNVAVDTTVTSVRGGASVAAFVTRRLGVDVGLGAGADVFHTTQTTSDRSVELSPTANLVDPIVTARALVGLRLASWAHLVVGVDVDYDFGLHHYVTAATLGAAGATSAQPVAVYEPWPVRPSLLVGLCVPIVDGRGCTE
ncbi:MAG: hypothetical protein ACRENE_06775 [Polyangiaceae bacterium]